MNKKLIALVVVALTAIATWAGPRGCPGPGPRRCPPPPHPAPHHHGGDWCHGGREAFWGTLAGSAVGTLIGAAVAPKTTVVEQPTVVVQQQPVVVQQTTPVATVQQTVTTTTTTVQPQTQQVWVEGKYVDIVQANGTVVRTWQPGHYETVVVQ